MTSITASRRTRLGGLAAMLVVPVLLLGLAACAPAAENGVDPGAESGANTMTQAEWQLKYAECMRAEGIDMPDPGAGGGVVMQSGGVDIGPADQKCKAELGDMPPASAEERDAADQESLEWGRGIADCYRENGFDMPDPKLGEDLQFPADAPESVQDECGAGADNTAKRAG
jgi:hypothetical protein